MNINLYNNELKINLIEIKKLNKAKKAIQYLEYLSSKLKKLDFESIDSFVIEPNKVSYFDVSSSEYKLYDFKEFNSVMFKIYYDLILGPIIEKNKIFNDFLFFMDSVYNFSKYHFHAEIFTIFHLSSWFIKSLRQSKKSQNKFNINDLILNFPLPFLEKSASLEENLNFVIDFINLLQEKSKIQIINSELSFINFDQSELDELLNLSFEPLVFGGNLNIDNCILIKDEIDISILNDPLITEDYKFNYVVAFATNYITYDNCSNNLFIENIKWRV